MDGIALASVISSGVVGAAAIGASVWGVRWAASLNRVNWLHERKAESYIEIIEAVETTGEATWEEARRRSYPDVFPGSAEPRAERGDASDEDSKRSARLSALEQIYASSDLKKALSAWRYVLTQIWEALSHPDADESETEDTRETLFGEMVSGQGNGLVHLERKFRAEVIDVVARELGQRR